MSMAAVEAALLRFRESANNGLGTSPGALPGVRSWGDQQVAGDNYDWVAATLGAKAPNAASGDPWWLNLANVISAPGKVLTNTLGNWTDDKGLNAFDPGRLGMVVGHKLMGQPANFPTTTWEDVGKDLMFDMLGHAGKGLKESVEGDLSWRHFMPTHYLGHMLASVGKEGKDSDTYLQNLTGYQNKQGWNWNDPKDMLFDTTSFLSDMVVDPINFITLGGGSAIKAGAKAMQNAAKAHGVAAKGQNAAQAVFDDTIAALTSQGVNSDLAVRLAKKRQTGILDAGAVAREKAQNALINFDVPFVNITKQFGQKPKFLQVSDEKIGDQAGTAIAQALSTVAGLKTTEDIARFLESKGYGTRNPAELTRQGAAHLLEQLQNVKPKTRNIPDFDVADVVTGYGQKVDYNKWNPEQFLSTLDPRLAERLAPMLRGLDAQENPIPQILGDSRNLGPDVGRNIPAAANAVELFGEALGKMPGTIKGNTAAKIAADADQAAAQLRSVENIATVSDDLSDPIVARSVTPVDKVTGKMNRRGMEQFVQDMGGVSKLGSMVKNPFNPRTLNSVEGAVNQAGEAITESQTKIRGRTRAMEREVAAINRLAKGLTKEQRESIPYIIEGKFPHVFDQASIVPQMTQVADRIKTVLDNIGEEGMKTGTLDNLLKDYFPHIITADASKLSKLKEKYKDDPMMSSLLGKSGADSSNLERKSFESLAQLDNDVLDLESKLKTASGDEAAKLQDRIDDLKSLFERDPIKALGQRAYKSIKANAMKELQDGFVKSGMMVMHKPGMDEAAALRATELSSGSKMTALNAEQMAQMGLDPKKVGKVYMHKEVLKGMESVQKLLTNDDTMNNLLHHAEVSTGLWKSLTTTAVPAHHFYNFLGNVANNMMAGVQPKHYTQAIKYMSGKGDEKVMQEMIDRGVLGQGYWSEFVRSVHADKAKGKFEKTVDKIENVAPLKVMREMGERSDDFSRIALFLKGMEQTGKPAQAASMVRKYLFNYGELTKSDRVIRGFVPFWNWTKNNLPLQINQLAQQPRFAAAYAKIREHMRVDDTHEDVPEYVNNQYLRVGEDTYHNFRLPINDLHLLGENPLKTGIGMLNPMLRMPFELALNKQAFNDRSITYDKEGFTGEDGIQDLSKYLLNQTGLPGRIVNSTIKAGQADEGERMKTLLQELGTLFGGRPYQR